MKSVKDKENSDEDSPTYLLYKKLYDNFKKCNPFEKNGKVLQNKANKMWREAKSENIAFEDLENCINKIISENNVKFLQSKASSVSRLFKKQTTAPVLKNLDSNTDCTTTCALSNKIIDETISNEEINNNGQDVPKLEIGRTYETPAQNILNKEISGLLSQLDVVQRAKDSNLSCFADPSTTIKNLRTQINQKKKKLIAIQKGVIRAHNFRSRQREFKNKIKTALEHNPDLLKKKTVHLQDRSGRPRLEDNQPDLLNTIAKIAMFGASASDRRRCDVLRSCKKLTDLFIEMENLGFKSCKTSLYYRFVPRSSHTIEGKRHVKTVPVKLCRAQSDIHKDHPDQNFCKSTINDLEIIASILGPKQVSFISSDDKAKVPIGITAAKAQAPFLMHMEYQVRLPDHDFVVAGQHKLTPSVYAGIEVKENMMGKREAVTYSGPTYIAIRSARHSSSTAATHSNDYNNLLNIKAFDTFVKDDKKQVKPVFIITSDGGPDENPRFPKTISFAVDFFKRHNLDALFWATNAPGRSAYNRVERRMAPLSRQLSGVIIPHDQFGSHLNANGKTVNKELELKNFQFAGETLAEVWEDMVIDGYSVITQYVSPEQEILEEPWVPNHSWYIKHVKESQYFLQVVKCDDKTCCSPFRSCIKDILPDRFAPSPYPLQHSYKKAANHPEKVTLTKSFIPKLQDDINLQFASLTLRQAFQQKPSDKELKFIPYDYYCCTVQKNLKRKICNVCNLYFATIKALSNHKTEMHSKKKFFENESSAENTETDDEVEANFNSGYDDASIPIIENIEDWLTSPWTDE